MSGLTPHDWVVVAGLVIAHLSTFGRWIFKTKTDVATLRTDLDSEMRFMGIKIRQSVRDRRELRAKVHRIESEHRVTREEMVRLKTIVSALQKENCD